MNGPGGSDGDDSDAATSPVFHATKNGLSVVLERDPHSDVTRYMVIEAPGGLLVLFPQDGRKPSAPPIAHLIDAPSMEDEDPAPDRESQLRRAFQELHARLNPSEWPAATETPFGDLVGALQSIMAQAPVAEDIAAYLAAHPGVANSFEMLFTSIAMSARADWRSAPANIRGVVARGWFLGRWLPTFLVLDGPILRFLKSTAFRRQESPSRTLRAVRRFFEAADFIQLRHAFAHWSFRWDVDGDDSTIVGTNDAGAETVRFTRAETDAFHILTYAVIEALDDVILRPRRNALRSAGDSTAAPSQSAMDRRRS